MTGPSPNHPVQEDPHERWLRRTWWLLLGSFAGLAMLPALQLAQRPVQPVDVGILALVLVCGAAAIAHRGAVRTVESGRRMEAESIARILQGLSRSVSPDAIVDAIADDLRRETDADHIVVVRRREAGSLEAILVSSRPGVQASTTILPDSDLEPESIRQRGGLTLLAGTGAPDAAGVAAERVAARVRTLYGLANTLAAPLRSERRVIGAIVLARRAAGPWPASTQRILAGAAVEASAALARARSHQAAEARASTDILTGLPNRRYFEEFCGLLGRRRRFDDAVGVLMIDIDRFKALNDAHGHATGDEVLRAVGDAIGRAVRDDDVPARYGGEEFAVLLRNPTSSDAIEVGERVRETVKRLDLSAFGVDAVSVSVGVAVAGSGDETIFDLIGRADRALYRAKRTGRDRVVAAA